MRVLSRWQHVLVTNLLLVTITLLIFHATLTSVEQAQNTLCTVTPIASAVNIRSGPSTNDQILSALLPGESREVAEKLAGQDGSLWWRLASGGWVSSTVVSANGDCDSVADHVITTSTFYVSKFGDNTDGLSWASAWNELDQINWGVIQPGDTVLIDGGAVEMIYTTTLAIGRHGTPGYPIYIKLADEPERNGKAIIFGGRSTPLPYCEQADYNFESEGVRDYGILVDKISWIVIDGTKWRGITIYGHNLNGIRLTGTTSNISVRNVEIYDNGSAYLKNNGWRSDSPGINLSGMNNSFERMIIHDNGQDAIQAGGHVGKFTLKDSWLYNERQHPWVDEAFNYCTHTDGIQIFNGGSLSDFLIENTIIGPGFTNGIIFGSHSNDGSLYAEVHNVVLRDVVFTKAANNNILAYPNTPATGWVLERVTAYCSNTKFYCLYLEGANHNIHDSIFYGAQVELPPQTKSNNNCQWETEGASLGAFLAPRFRNVSRDNNFSIDDYAQLPGSPCNRIGSNLTSVNQLLSQPSVGISAYE